MTTMAEYITMAQDQRKKMRDLGRRGGRACVKRHGRHHMAAIGARGFATTLAKHWQGDKPGMVAWLHERAAVSVADTLATMECRRQIASGAAVACVEIPCY